MSLHYILDGYNVLHKIPFPESRTFEAQREALIRFLEERRPQGSPNNAVTIIFDGQPEHYGGHSSPTMRVIFTEGESADEKIKKMVADAVAKGHIVVVTDDRAIRYAVRADGVQVLSVRDFLSQASAGSSGTSGKGTTSGKGERLAPQMRQKIDEEMKKIWLK